MNIIEAIQHAESGKLIRNGILKRIDHFLEYKYGGVFYEYELVIGKSLMSTKRFQREVSSFSVGFILSNDWEVFDAKVLLEEK